MQYQVSLDESLRPGVTAARLARNASMPATVQDGEVQDGETQVGTLEDGSAVMVPKMVPNMVPNPELIGSDEAYMIWVNIKAAQSYNANLPNSTQQPPVTGGGSGHVREVVRRKGIQALINRGMIATVQPTIDSIADPVLRATMQNEFDNSQTFQIDRPSLIAIATAIGIADLQEWFDYASSLS